MSLALHICTNISVEGQLIIRFEYTSERVNRIRTISGRQWHSKEKYWTIPLEVQTIAKFFKVFNHEDICIEKDTQELLIQLNFLPNIESRYKDVIKRSEEQLKLKGYSPKTLKAYLGHIQRFLLYHQKDVNSLSEEDIRKYLIVLLDDKAKSHAYVNQVISSIKFFFYDVLKHQNKTSNLPRPKKEHKLPEVLTQKEVNEILNSVLNTKHKVRGQI